ncbi:hypothetical protein GCM10022243_11450 [Saccharothrix violaceirubra]|uniref:Imm1 family immunity protein n=1 Tax=Saccharothrix violaceirubra TaxID=413306 RepID=UPI0016156238
MIVTASLTTGIVTVLRGEEAFCEFAEKLLITPHPMWESVMSIGDQEYFAEPLTGGPVPNHQLRISVDPVAGFAALNYCDHDDDAMPLANSYNPGHPSPQVDLIFSGATGAVFPRSAAVPIEDARKALHEWFRTGLRPRCIKWRPYDQF